MSKFKFIYTEHWFKEVEVEADTEEDAYEKACMAAQEGHFEIEKTKDNFLNWEINY